ncbi:MAG: MaoC/PaaZ C-terminal domain-containing protein [Halobacteriaceae archaeon]
MDHFEDLAAGDTFDCGRAVADRTEMVAFAERFDPQPFHVDADAAAGTPFGGVVASGWYTCALCTRRLVAGCLEGLATTGGRGVDDLRWHEPLRPGDELAVTATVAERAVTSENRGEVRLRVEGDRVDGDETEPLVGFDGLVLVSRRGAGE